MCGALARAATPQALSSIGTSRQPITRWPSASTLRSISSTARRRSCSSWGRKHIATP